MATVVLTYPRDGGTYQTTAAGGIVPFVAQGYVDEPGATVSLYEDSTGVHLGSAAASSTPMPGFPNRYAWSMTIASWTGAAIGTGVPAASLSVGAGAVSITAVLGVPGANLVTGANPISFSVPGSLGVPSANLTLSAAAISITSGGGGGALFFDDFASDSSASYTVAGDGGEAPFAVSSGKLRRVGGDWTAAMWLRVGHTPTDGVLSAKIAMDATAKAYGGEMVTSGVVARCSGGGANQIAASLCPTGVVLYHRASGAWSKRGSYAFSPVAGTEYLIALSFVAGNLSVKVDGVERITATTTVTASGGVGVSDGRADDGGGESVAQGTTTFDDLTLEVAP
jgi:hypothetical protein